MRQTLRITALAIAAAALLVLNLPKVEEEQRLAAAPAPIAAGAPPPVPSLERPRAADPAIGHRRNLFAYVARPPRAIAAAPVARAATIAVAPPPALDETPRAAAPEPPRFPYRYIGRFGKDADPLAAFVRDGEVVTVRRGGRIGEGFTLRAIGIESVEVKRGGASVRVALER